MNIENLKRTIELLKSIPDEKFNMTDFRESNGGTIQMQECDTVGCIIGHATVLDTEENFKKHFSVGFIPEFNSIDFWEWSYDFYALNIDDEKDRYIWDYLFTSYWATYPKVIEYDKDGKLGSREHAIYRINHVIDGYEPSDIDDEIEAELVIL